MITKSNVRNLCTFDFVESAIVPSIIELDEGTLLLTNILEIIFTCNNLVTKKPGCSYCLMKLPGFCSVLAGSFSFSPRLAACQDRSPTTLATSPGVNLALLQQFFNHSSVSDANSDQWYLSKVPYSIPHLKIASSDVYKQHVRKDQRLRMNLIVITDHMKRGKAVYRNLLDAFMLSDAYSASPDTWQLSHIFSYISFALTILLSIAMFIMCQKLRSLLLLAALAHAPKVRAAYPPLTWSDPNPLPEGNAPASLDTDSVSYASFIVVDHSIVSTQAFMCLLLIIVILIHIKIALRSLTYSSEVTLEICGCTQRVNVFLCSVPKCPGDYCIPFPTWLQSLSIIPINLVWGELHLKRPHLTIKDRRTGQEINIPRVVKLSLFETYKLKKIRKEDYTVFLKIKHGDTATYLRKPTTESQHSPPAAPSPQLDSLCAETAEALYPRLPEDQPHL